MRKQSKIDLEDTIAAISTPPGEGAIGIVRISGKDSVGIADAIFKSKKDKSPSGFRSFSAHYGYIYNKAAAVVDEALLTLMRAPKSYTKEDVVEINCHSGIISLRKTLELVLDSGARLAEPGEFTKRAFLNGRLDLAQAEAVLDIIRSKTEASLRMALGQLSGQLSSRLNDIKERLLAALANIEASIDFPEEDIEIISVADIKGRLKTINDDLAKLLESAQGGIILREGLTSVICGKPNVGKSSLLNALLQRDRAIVTHVPGTTRDAIEDFANINGIPFKLVDTAGIAPTEDLVEREGILRSRERIEQADLILMVLDAGAGMTDEDRILLSDTKDRPRILVINKADLPRKIDLRPLEGNVMVIVSAKEADGIDELKRTMERAVWSGRTAAPEGGAITNLRQKQALKNASAAAGRAVESVEKDLSPELIAIELKEALDSIGEITGEIVTDDILDRVFSQFCIGK
jgi:tRNA modification GTPase